MWGSLRLAPIIYGLRAFVSSMWGSLRLAPIMQLQLSTPLGEGTKRRDQFCVEANSYGKLNFILLQSSSSARGIVIHVIIIINIDTPKYCLKQITNV